MIETSPKGKRRTVKSQGIDQQSNSTQETAGSPVSGEPTYLVVGKLRRPHGVKGDIIMDVLTDFPQRLRRGKKVFVGPQHTPQVIRGIRAIDQALLVSFEGFEDCDQVGVLRNLEVYVQAASLPELPEGEYYYHQLIGLRVVDETGNMLGELAEILETGANDVYVVHDAQGKEILLPVIDEVVLEIDLARGEIRVRPPDWR
ncbi:MAG TPA: ribosome maturation factor RimM [Anaerolineaceae bacterium]|nr:ribosome maturation factor RimM [Anaerolineaceae bacterium]